MRKIILISFAIFSGTAAADPVENQAQLALLPPFCSGTQDLRTVSKDPTSIEDYVKIYGKTYLALHHYCWALNSENKAWRISDKPTRESDSCGDCFGHRQEGQDRVATPFPTPRGSTNRETVRPWSGPRVPQINCRRR